MFFSDNFDNFDNLDIIFDTYGLPRKNPFDNFDNLTGTQFQ